MSANEASLLVLGAGGRIGRLLRSVWSERIPVLWHSRRPEVGFESCDVLANPDKLVELTRGCTAVLCLAGVTEQRNRKTGACFQDNSLLAQAAIVAAQVSGCPRVLLTSSAAVYGRAGGLLSEETPGVEVSQYGESKLEMEIAGAALGQASGVEVCSLRLGNLAGADAILGAWQPRFCLDTFDDGQTPQRSYLGVLFLADVIQRLVTLADVPSVVNVAQPGLVSMGALLDAAGLRWSSRPAPSHAIRVVHMSTELLETALGKALPLASPIDLVEDWQRATAVPEGVR